MTPAARTQAAIGLLTAISDEANISADKIATEWFRKRRYAGSKDRAWVLFLVFSVLRRRGELDWALKIAEPSARERILAALVNIEQMDFSAISSSFREEKYGPDPLSLAEEKLVKTLEDKDLNLYPPDWVKANVPKQLSNLLLTSLGRDWISELAGLAEPAPLDLRVNTLKTNRQEVQALLLNSGIDSQITPLSPVGLRVRGRANIVGSRLFQDGLVEIQDEGSQIMSLLVDARPGQSLIDACAGSGGKSLALASVMSNKGKIFAYDNNLHRLGRANKRIARAGVKNIKIVTSTESLTNSADRVLIDAPCSGSGTWRRDPALKWRTTLESISAKTVLQGNILETFSPFVALGGRLIYVTCSLFSDENEQQVTSFLKSHPEFKPFPVGDVWKKLIGSSAPEVGPHMIQLTPFRTGTDGFFLGSLERVS